MRRQWTFGQRLGLGFAIVVLLSIAVGGVGLYSLRATVDSKDEVITGEAPLLVEIEQVGRALERKVGASRGFLLSGEQVFTDRMRTARGELVASLSRIRGRVGTEELRGIIDTILRLEADHQDTFDKIALQRQAKVALDVVSQAFEDQVAPKRNALDDPMAQLLRLQQQRVDAARIASSEAAATTTTIMLVIMGLALLLAIAIAIVIARGLSVQISGAVGKVQSSSAELQAAATQQATGAKEQSTAMNEITTTINELLATSRQIAESAQRVAQVAGQTAGSARTGDGTVEKAHEAIAGIRRQVDLVVHHMLELGKKSQQIGAVLDIVSELAEQTNILAINATIEAAGAGESGKRFAVVADEIRKLADRVGGSTKEIRTLIEDVRGAVNTTVMATETGSKAVEAGTRQFGEVATAFKQIGGMVGTTTEAAREIELSTKQQTTAVEQVNVAIANVAQATRETEASSSQTLTTASQLAMLSKDLLRLVQPQSLDRA